MTYSNRSYVEVEKTILISFDYYYQKSFKCIRNQTNCTCEKQKSRPSHSDQTKYIRGEQARAIAAAAILLCISLHHKQQQQQQQQQQQRKQRPNRFLLLFRFNASTILLVETVIKSRRSIISACHNIYGLFFFSFPPTKSFCLCCPSMSGCSNSPFFPLLRTNHAAAAAVFACAKGTRALALLLAHSSQCPPPHY